jgi:hypothetical protein
MTDQPVEAATTSSFAAMGGQDGSVPSAAGDELAAQLDRRMQSAATAATREAAAESADLGGGMDFGLAGKPMDEQLARLDAVMEEAAIAANAERDLEGVEDEELEEVDEDEELVDEDLEPGKAEAETPSERRRWTRTQAQRVAAELEAHKGERAARLASDQRILDHLQQQSGYAKEDNGRSRYENLSERVLKGTATAEEHEEVNGMTAWHEFAQPIYHAAQTEVAAAFGAGFRSSIEATVKSESLSPEAATRLWRASDPIREAVLLGRKLERKAAEKNGAVRPGAAPVRPQPRTPTPPARVGPAHNGSRGESWMDKIMTQLDRQMEVAGAAANAQRDRELAELEAEDRRRRRVR